MPDLRHLRLFLAVAEERNFTRAAERVHMAQQAVSKAVAQLERELGVELLERTTREVRLTPAGAALLAAGPDALAGVERAFAAAVEVGRGLAGTVRLGATPALGLTVLDAATQALRDGCTGSRRGVPRGAPAATSSARCATGRSTSCSRGRWRSGRTSTARRCGRRPR